MKQILNLSLLACLWLSLPVARGADPVKLPAKEQFHLFILAGQSNMAGRGVVEPAENQPDPRVLVFKRELEWAPALDPLHFDKPSVGVGPGRAFGLAIAQAEPGITVGLIPCAVGGSGIDRWVPGALDPPTNTHPWDDCMRRVSAARPAGVLKGIIWHQGETDSSAELAPGYAGKLQALIARFRETLMAPELPFVVGQMGQFAGAPWKDERKLVDRAHQELPSQVKGTAYVSAEGLHDKGDLLHFDAPSARELGRRYAAAYFQLQKTK